MKKKETNKTKQKNWQEKLFNKKWSNEMKKTTTKNKNKNKNCAKRKGGGWNLLKKMELIIWSTLEGVWQSYDEWCKGERGGLKDWKGWPWALGRMNEAMFKKEIAIGKWSMFFVQTFLDWIEQIDEIGFSSLTSYFKKIWYNSESGFLYTLPLSTLRGEARN